jgi:hypothetical protein
MARETVPETLRRNKGFPGFGQNQNSGGGFDLPVPDLSRPAPAIGAFMVLVQYPSRPLGPAGFPAEFQGKGNMGLVEPGVFRSRGPLPEKSRFRQGVPHPVKQGSSGKLKKLPGLQAQGKTHAKGQNGNVKGTAGGVSLCGIRIQTEGRKAVLLFPHCGEEQFGKILNNPYIPFRPGTRKKHPEPSGKVLVTPPGLVLFRRTPGHGLWQRSRRNAPAWRNGPFKLGRDHRTLGFHRMDSPGFEMLEVALPHGYTRRNQKIFILNVHSFGK